MCLFCANTILLADSSTLTPLVGNPKVYQDMRKMMEEHLVAHKDPLDESVKLEELRNPTSAVASTAETPYEVVLEKTGPQSWKASTILGKRNFALVKADSKTSSDIQEAYRQFVIHTYGRDKGKAIVRSLFTDDPHETTILLVCSAKIAGLYRVTGNYINRVYVDPDYRGQGAVDVMIEDIEARVLNGERDKKVRYRVIREHRRANQGYNEGALEKFKQDLGVRSIVRVASARSSSSGAADALKILPYEWHDSDLNMGYFIAELSRLLQIENILEQDKSAFVFSEKVTFDNGVGSAYLQSQAAGNAANQYANAANQGIQYSKDIYGNITNSTLPYQNTGLQANNAINSMLPGQYTNSTGGTSTGNGYLTAQPTMNDLTTLMPNYQFGLQQGMGQFNAGINAAGGAVSGNAIQGGQQFAQDYAGNQLQNAFGNFQANRQNVASNLYNASNIGSTGVQTAANAGTGTSSNVSNMLSSIGNANASATMGSANAQAGGLNNISNYAMLYGMMNKTPTIPAG